MPMAMGELPPAQDRRLSCQHGASGFSQPTCEALSTARTQLSQTSLLRPKHIVNGGGCQRVLASHSRRSSLTVSSSRRGGDMTWLG